MGIWYSNGKTCIHGAMISVIYSRTFHFLQMLIG
jgi:hypothetical protein